MRRHSQMRRGSFHREPIACAEINLQQPCLSTNITTCANSSLYILYGAPKSTRKTRPQARTLRQHLVDGPTGHLECFEVSNTLSIGQDKSSLDHFEETVKNPWVKRPVRGIADPTGGRCSPDRYPIPWCASGSASGRHVEGCFPSIHFLRF